MPGEIEQDKSVIQEVPEPSQDASVIEQEDNQDRTPEETEEKAVQEQPVRQQEDLDERGVPWKNRAMELERKFSEIPQIIRQTVEEANKVSQTPKQQEYTIEQLEQFAAEQPNHRPWVEAEKAKIIQRNLERTLDNRLQENERRGKEALIRQQSEQWVTTHPKFKECFTRDMQGNAVWNMSHPLSQTMASYLNQPDPVTGRAIRERPDALTVVAKMAYADYSLSQEPKSHAKETQLKKDLRKAQRAQMVPVSGTPAPQGQTSGFRKSLDSYKKTYSKDDIRSATREHLKAVGLIRE